ncbi:NAD(P)-binding domain-containing protein [Shimia sp. FJ5]|uniref:NAD(P)-binding domain-containing protein n=1 Tax=Shimia sp. FJ5 TaxID=3079054 RepID=UPI0026259E3E|nr:NAD(P)-binding domain-containing protein [Shimia sp. FJ5]MDV4146294.1 NAD(P)-binding domain-containing protein [Shimia sp. FJ5]
MRIGFLGTGTIASAVVEGIAGDGHVIIVSRRSEARSSALAEAYSSVHVGENQEVLDQSDVVFLGLMAETAAETLAPLTFRENQAVISFMAGATLEAVGEMVRPARAAAVMMPFPGIAQGGSPIMMQGDAGLVKTIFGARNKVFALGDDSELQAYLAAQAVLSPVAAMVGEAAAWLGARVEDAGQGEAFLRMLVASSLAETGCADLVAALNTPGGYNQRLRVHMEEAGIGAALTTGLDALEG